MGSNIVHHFITIKSKNHFNIVVKLTHFSNDRGQKLSFKAFQQNGLLAYPKNVLLGMLMNDKEDIPKK